MAIPLIINADDFGYSSAVNRAVIKAYREGVLTSTSLMVNERATGEAVQLAKENPDLAVGLHLVLVLGHSSLPHDQIPSLTNQNNEFSNSPPLAGVKYFFSPQARRELKKEMRAQFEKFAATGLPFSHVDGHTHLHMHPVIFDELIPLCEEFNVRRIRVAKSEMKLSLSLDRSSLLLKVLLGIVFNLLAKRCYKKLAGRGFVVPEKVYGLLQTGNMNKKYVLGLIPKMAKVPGEIYAHPLSPDAEKWNLEENPGGTVEFNVLLSSDVRETILLAGFSPTTYRQL
jgi:hopanoid biosynthesis associated protein HpnK